MPSANHAGSIVTPIEDTGPVKTAADRANSEAGKLLKHFNAAKPATPDAYVPSFGMPGGGDITLQPGLFTGALIGPGVWPTESETELAQAQTTLKKLSGRHQEAASDAKRQTDDVFAQDWTDGDGKEAAYEHYSAEQRAHMAVVDVCDAVAATNGRLSEHIRLAKRNIRDAHDTAHREIEKYLNAPGGIPTAQIAVITTQYRTLIEGFRGQLVEQVGDETASLSNKFGFPEAPPGNPSQHDKPDDSGRGMPHADADARPDPKTDESLSQKPPGGGLDRGMPQTEGSTDPGALDPATAGVSPSALSGRGLPQSIGDTASKPPSMPSMPSPPSMGSGGGGSGGGGSSPLSSMGSGMGGMQGMSGAAKGPAGLPSPASGLQAPAASSGGGPASMGSEFGRGVAAGNAAAGGMPPLASSAPPQTPTGPLSAAPLSQASAPASAAPTAATVPASATPSAGAGSGGMGGGIPAGGLGGAGASSGGSAPMSSYGSVLPPAATPSAVPGAAGAGGSAPAASAAGAAGGAAAAAGAPGFLPGVRDVGGGQRVGRDVSMTDLESARAVVADLAAASSVIYPGLEWAVAVSRGASGQPEMWVTTNEGAGYIPAGVHIRRSMPLAAHFDSDFDARWFGWFNPAETVLRAVRLRGDALSAVATTWAQDSDEVRSATPDVAIGVTPSGPPSEAEASALTRGRSHRLETIAPALFVGLQRDADEAERYARQLTQQVVFSGPEMSTAAMSVARSIIAAQWPTEREWDDLSAQYEMDRLMAGSQRPGLMGVEEPHQLAAYQHDFAQCRRMETLLCWQNGDLADVVYAAITAGASAPALV
ncbi:hypothetical protein [Mycolicibacterium obuense]|uniref:hypothetical protein n=1 Tax=Mycolicibacterium obuense TaxID=1807 RepID=UPI000B2D6409|nr:hypothetical protein [Mycolicibacterium obuense]